MAELHSDFTGLRRHSWSHSLARNREFFAVTNPFKTPLPPALLAKLGSIVVHADEACSDSAHSFDVEALKALIAQPDVQDFIVALGPLVPVKRNMGN